MNARLPVIFALVVRRAIRGRGMGINSSMRMWRMGIFRILGFVGRIGLLRLMIVAWEHTAPLAFRKNAQRVPAATVAYNATSKIY